MPKDLSILKNAIKDLFVVYSQICTERVKYAKKSRLIAASPWKPIPFEIELNKDEVLIKVKGQEIRGKVSGFILLAEEYWRTVLGHEFGTLLPIWYPSSGGTRAAGGNVKNGATLQLWFYPDNLEKKAANALISAAKFYFAHRQEQEAVLCLRKAVVGTEISMYDPAETDLLNSFPESIRKKALKTSLAHRYDSELRRSGGYWFHRVSQFGPSNDPISREGAASEIADIIEEFIDDESPRLASRFKKYWPMMKELALDHEPYVRETGLAVAAMFAHTLFVYGEYEASAEVSEITISAHAHLTTQLDIRIKSLAKLRRTKELPELKQRLTALGKLHYKSDL